MRKYYWSTTRSLKAYVWAEVEETTYELEDVSRGTTEEQMRSQPLLAEALDRWREGDDAIFAEAMADSLVAAIARGDGPGATWAEDACAAICREHLDVPACVTALDLAARVDAINAEATALVGDTQGMIDLDQALAQVAE
jgi:hypothetical protein